MAIDCENNYLLCNIKLRGRLIVPSDKEKNIDGN